MANYVEFTYDAHVARHASAAFPSIPVRWTIDPSADTLYPQQRRRHVHRRQRRVGHRRHRPDRAWASSAPTTTTTATPTSSWPTTYARNFLFHNDGTGRFRGSRPRRRARPTTATAVAQGSMGVDCGDYDNDGWLDFFMTSYQRRAGRCFTAISATASSRTSRAPPAQATARCLTSSGAAASSISTTTATATSSSPAAISQDNVERFDDTTSYHAPQHPAEEHRATGSSSTCPDQCGDGLQVNGQSAAAPPSTIWTTTATSTSVILNSRARADRSSATNRPTGNHWLQVRLAGRQDQPRRRRRPRQGRRPAT